MKTAVSWLLRLVLAGLFLMAGGAKLLSDPVSVDMFTTLGMEPGGRILIGVLEVVAAFLVLWPATVARGALLAFWIMLGALIAHLTRIGFDLSSWMWGVAFTASCGLLILHRGSLPFLAKALGDE